MELYPSDSDLNALSGTTDAEQEVLYVPAGQSPYYTSFYKMLHRLLNVARRAGDLRVYKDGGLTFGVRAGKFTDGATARDFAAVSGVALVDNQANYIYLTAGGVLTVNQAGFPDAAASPHLPLATITTFNGAYAETDIVDQRSRSLFRPTGLPVPASSINAANGVAPLDAAAKLPAANLPTSALVSSQINAANGVAGTPNIVAKGNGDALAFMATNVVSGAASAVALPAITAADVGKTLTMVFGGSVSITATAAPGVTIDAGASGGSAVDSVAAEAGYASLTLQATSTTTWIIVSYNGTWVVS